MSSMAKRQLSCTDAGSSQGFLGSKLDSPTVWPDQQEQDLVLFVHNWFDPGRLFAELLVFRRERVNLWPHLFF